MVTHAVGRVGSERSRAAEESPGKSGPILLLGNVALMIDHTGLLPETSDCSVVGTGGSAYHETIRAMP